MKIALIVEGKTEKAFLPVLRDFLKTRLAGNMPKFTLFSYDGRIPTGDKLRLAGHNRNAPSGNPESVNHNKPPAHRIMEIFEIGRCRDSYIKPRDAGRILRDNDLSEAVSQCAELKALVNTILSVSGGTCIS